MTVLQGLAGDLAGVEIVFWAVDEEGAEVAREAYIWMRMSMQNDILEGNTCFAPSGFKHGSSNHLGNQLLSKSIMDDSLHILKIPL